MFAVSARALICLCVACLDGWIGWFVRLRADIYTHCYCCMHVLMCVVRLYQLSSAAAAAAARHGYGEFSRQLTRRVYTLCLNSVVSFVF